MLFLEADEATLLDRFKETRRRHPLAPDGRVLEGIRAEREVLGPLREAADLVMDTSDLTGGMLRRRVVTDLLGPKADQGKLAATSSPSASRTARRARPTWFSTCASCPTRTTARISGPDRPRPEGVEYVEAGELASEFYARLFPLLDFLLPAYVTEGKTHLTIGIGCTGGRHRSLTVAARIAEHFGDHEDVSLRVVHRDVEVD